ncbi:MAG: hypothetical protein ACK55I_43400, partial [bacterium]
MEAAINKASNNLMFVGQDLEAIASGKVSLKGTSKDQNIFENPNAYSTSQRTAAVNRASGIFGKDAGFVKSLIGVGANIKDTMAKMSADAQKSGISKDVVGENIQRSVDRQLRDAFGDNDLSRQISKQLKEALDRQIKNKETDEIDLDQLMAETTGLPNLLESEKKAYKALADATKLATDAISLYSDQLDKANSMLNESNA